MASNVDIDISSKSTPTKIDITITDSKFENFRTIKYANNIYLRHSTVGNYVTFGENASVYNCTIGEGSNIGRDVNLIDCTIGPYSTIEKGVVATDLKIYEQCYITWDSRVFGTKNGIIVIYTPTSIFVKPGCYPLEPISQTLKRLKEPNRISKWKWVKASDRESYAHQITKWLKKHQEYTIK